MIASSYADRKGAMRAASRNGFVDGAFTVELNAEGRFEVHTASVDVNTVVASPVAYVWEFLASHPDMPRKAQVEALRAQGLNHNMINTQTSRFYVAGGDRAAWYALDRARKAARA